MRVKYIGQTDWPYLTEGKVYDVMSIEKNWYRILTDMGDGNDYLFPPKLFEVIAD